jgi:Co/Zn/Cd efflux system component
MKKKKEDKADGIFAIIAALLVLFTNLIDPVYSVALAIILLVGFSIYKFVKR